MNFSRTHLGATGTIDNTSRTTFEVQKPLE
jgi:hypothetical protein